MTSATTEPAQTELKEDLHPPSGIEGVDGSDVDAAAGLEPAERVASELLLAHNQASTSAAGVLNSDLTGQAVLNLRPVRPRQTFSEEQVSAMEAMFERKQYLAPPERQALADLVKLTPQQVRVWFQNRRQKIKQYLCLRQGREQRGKSVCCCVSLYLCACVCVLVDGVHQPSGMPQLRFYQPLVERCQPPVFGLLSCHHLASPNGVVIESINNKLRDH